MPLLTDVIAPGTVSAGALTTAPTSAPPLRSVPTGTLRQLHTELAAVGLPVSGAETLGTPQFGPNTQARVREFQQMHGLPVTAAVDPTTGGVMTLAAMMAAETDRSALRASLRAAQGKVPNSPEYDYWLTRCAIAAGDYDLAATVRPDAREGGMSIGRVADILDAAARPQAPEAPFPENFYTCRFELMPPDLIAALRKGAPDDLPKRLAGPPQSDTAGSANADAVKRTLVALRPRSDPNGDPPGVPEVPPPPPPVPPDQTPQALAASASAWLDAVEAWQFGNAEFAKQRYANAVAAYDSCQVATLAYFALMPDYQLLLSTPTLAGRMDELVFALASKTAFWSDLWSRVNVRRQLLSLAELGQHDWKPIADGDDVFRLLQGNLAGKPDALPPAASVPSKTRQSFMDARLLILSAVLVPLARADANRLRRQYAAALDDLTRFARRDIPVPDSNPPKTIPAVLGCEFIEYPFARLLAGETLIDQGEAQYKAKLSVDDESSAPKKATGVARLKALADDFTRRKIPDGGGSAATQPFQNLAAALTYASVLDFHQTDGEYVPRAKQALDTLYAAVNSAVDSGDVTSLAFQSLGQTMTVPTIRPIGPSLPGLTTGTHPHEPYLQFTTPPNAKAMREKNPRVYALLLTAQARLLQIWSGFNYLGYRDDYVAPWRFQYLLDRSRYFAEHAKNAQRDYLNFLANAENEELQELSAAQNVELEKANVQIESARVKQTATEVRASKESAVLADLNSKDADQRLTNYREFEFQMAEADAASFLSSVVGGVTSAIVATAATGGVGAAAGVGIVAHAVGAGADAVKASAQRDLERQNLELAAGEARQAKRVAAAQLEVAKAGKVVAGLQRQAALLRHEFALQSLQFMRNRTLNPEQWYRLAGAIRSVGDTYLRYAIETAFLAQQAYNFEADGRLNVIRFDYDVSDVGGMLAADFLLRDLDTLEQDLIVSQKTRLQHVRYVVSLAREFPDLLQALGETGEGFFSVRLERLERHLPGLFNLRIDSVDLQPIALMDTTRTSIELTHLGTGMIRLKAQPGASPLNSTDLAPGIDWLQTAAADWPAKIHVSGAEATFFTGLSRQEAAASSPISANQRSAFEGLPGASSWRINMSLSENRVVNGSLGDIILTFTLSGYQDADLRARIDAVKRETTALTTVLSAQQTFPDAFYDFSRSGRMVWKLRRELLTSNGDLGRLRNIGFSLRPGAPTVHFSRLMARLRVSFRVDESGGVASGVTVFTAIPDISVSQSAPLTVAVRAAINGATELAWDFGDGGPIVRTVRSGSTPIPPAEGSHTYAKPGRYVITLRCVQNDSLSEYRVGVTVSRTRTLGDPLIVAPSRFTFNATTKAVTIATRGAVQQAGRILWRVGHDSSEGNSATFTLRPGTYALDFAAVRTLNFKAYGTRRFVNGAAPLPLRGLNGATNLTFDANGKETNGTGTPPLPARNELTKRLFEKGIISPDDDWAFELIPEEVTGVPGSPANGEELDLSDIQDLVLSMEYEIAPRGA